MKEEPGLAKFSNATCTTTLSLQYESGKHAGWVVNATIGKKIYLPEPIGIPPDQDLVLIAKGEGFENFRYYMTMATYNLMRRTGAVFELRLDAHIGDVEDVYSDHTINVRCRNPAKQDCPECHGTKVYNCPFKGPVPCSLCGES